MIKVEYDFGPRVTYFAKASQVVKPGVISFFFNIYSLSITHLLFLLRAS